jgi:hypothetical protein
MQELSERLWMQEAPLVRLNIMKCENLNNLEVRHTATPLQKKKAAG